MLVHVEDVSLESGSSIAIGYGTLDDGTAVRFAGDWRPMRDIKEALAAAPEDDLPVAEVEDWAILGRWSK